MSLALIKKAKYSYDKSKEKNISLDNFVFSNPKDALTQYKVLTEMRDKYHSAVKFYSDSRNEDQLNLSYKEIESFMEIYEHFEWFFTFSIDNMSEDVYNKLPEEYK